VLVPLFHNTGFVDQLSQMVLVGGSVDLVGEFSVAGSAAALTRRPPTYLIAVPSIFRLLTLSAAPDAALRECRVAAYGGASMPSAWIAELAGRWPHLHLFNCYGLTEFTSVTHVLGPEYGQTRGDSVGRPVKGVRQLIVGEGRRELPAGQEGEIWVSGPMRMLGYWRDNAATRRVFRGEWLRTGDLGRVDGQGFLTVAGRAAEIINRGGEKIHATQVEAALNELPGIADAAVVGAPHPVMGERVVAAIVPRAAHHFESEAIQSYLLERIADYAVPEEFVLVDYLPRNAAGKLERRRIREQLLGLVDREMR
jgi:acyl-CoA synthetase (AMP-forming)/AMP-acid ligase II